MITLPFYPLRPVTGPKLTVDNVLYEASQFKARGYLLSPKLNGDRGILEVTRTGCVLWNRHGSRYSASPVDLDSWKTLPAGTILDGEIWRKHFYPFGCLATSVADLTLLGESDRIQAAMSLCAATGNPWVFAEPSNEWLITEAMSTEIKTIRKWEGIVAKLASAPYKPMKTADQESPFWVKLKY